MGILSRLLGLEPRQPAPQQPRQPQAQPPQGQAPAQPRAMSEDERALERYRYLLRTAPPDAVEKVHAEAFAQLSPQQRSTLLREIASGLPAHERPDAWRDDPASLARLATRAELRQPGFMERTFGRLGGYGGVGGYGSYGGGGFAGMGGGLGMGNIFGSFLAGMAGSMIANEIFEHMGSHHMTDPFVHDHGGERFGYDDVSSQYDTSAQLDDTSAQYDETAQGDSYEQADLDTAGNDAAYEPDVDIDSDTDDFGGFDDGGGGGFDSDL